MALDSLLCSRQRMQIDQMDLLIHRAASLCASHGLSELSFLENLDLYQYVSSGGTWEDLSLELHAAQHGDDASDESSRLMRRIMHYIDLHYAEDIRIYFLEIVHKALLQAGPEAVYIPRNQFHLLLLYSF